MSFAQSFSEARSIQGMIQQDKQDGRDGAPCSAILKGHDSPGTSMAPPISELTPKRTKVHVRTSRLTRKYAAS